jgi:membrane associated rhomboid family serine protease
MVPIVHHIDKEQAQLYSLILNSVGIVNRVVATGGDFCIHVPHTLKEKALEAIDRYYDENFDSDEGNVETGTPNLTHIPVSGIFVALLLLSVHLAVTTSSAPGDYMDVFGADASRIVRGETYRCVTALLLHSDAVHLAGNMVGLILFGGVVSSVAGTGVGWLAILICGIVGNWMNASAYEVRHLSIGASTSVFGAVGIMSAYQAVIAKQTGKGWKRVGLALGGGLGLLAFLGTSARSDLGAHLFGFVVGGAMGASYGKWIPLKKGPAMQWLSGVAAALLVVGAWVRGATG